jgi:hypothetical protein
VISAGRVVSGIVRVSVVSPKKEVGVWRRTMLPGGTFASSSSASSAKRRSEEVGKLGAVVEESAERRGDELKLCHPTRESRELS